MTPNVPDTPGKHALSRSLFTHKLIQTVYGAAACLYMVVIYTVRQSGHIIDSELSECMRMYCISMIYRYNVYVQYICKFVKPT